MRNFRFRMPRNKKLPYHVSHSTPAQHLERQSRSVCYDTGRHHVRRNHLVDEEAS